MDYKLQKQKEFYQMRARAEVVGHPDEDGRGNQDIYHRRDMPQAIATGQDGYQARFAN